MPKTEKYKIQEFVGKLSGNDFSNANKILTDIVAEKLKTRIKTCLNKQTENTTDKNK